MYGCVSVCACVHVRVHVCADICVCACMGRKINTCKWTKKSTQKSLLNTKFLRYLGNGRIKWCQPSVNMNVYTCSVWMYTNNYVCE